MIACFGPLNPLAAPRKVSQRELDSQPYRSQACLGSWHSLCSILGVPYKSYKHNTQEPHLSHRYKVYRKLDCSRQPHFGSYREVTFRAFPRRKWLHRTHYRLGY